MRGIDQIVVAYRDSFRDYLYDHWNIVWTIYILFLIGIAISSYYLIFFKKSEHQIKLTLRSIVILNIIVALFSLYELSAPSNISMWPIVQDGLIALIFLDVIFYVGLKTINKHLSLRIVLFLLCFLSLAALALNFVLVELIPINKPIGSGLLALIQITSNEQSRRQRRAERGASRYRSSSIYSRHLSIVSIIKNYTLIGVTNRIL